MSSLRTDINAAGLVIKAGLCDLLPAAPVAVAVSGGADSVAGLLLLLYMQRTYGAPSSITVLTYQHGLRPEAAEECAFVASLAEKAGVECITGHAGDTLKHSRKGIQEKAREARYAFFAEVCAQKNINTLITCHHAEDNAETLFLRLQAGAGANGMRGIALSRTQGKLTLLRPFLTLTKADFTGLCRAAGVLWREDASNADAAYSRVRVRRYLQSEPHPEETVKRVNAAARAFAVDEAYLSGEARRAAAAYVSREHGGYYRIGAGILTLHNALCRRVFAALSEACAADGRPARAAAVTGAMEAAREAVASHAPLTRPFGGYVLRYHPKEAALTLIRDAARMAVIPAGAHTSAVRYDNRFLCRPPAGAGALCSLAEALRRAPAGLRRYVLPAANLPEKAAEALPAAALLDKRLALPHIFYKHSVFPEEVRRMTAFMPCAPVKLPLFRDNAARFY